MIRRPRGLFVTGTDTGVGKTVVTAALAVALNAQGLKTGIMKPIETGADQSGLSDSDWLIVMTGAEASRHLITPYRFRTSAAPLVAAAAEGTTIDFKRIVSAWETLCTQHDCLIVEGVGGVLVPLTPDLMVTDLIRMMELPVLVVAHSGLGSINHTLLTVQALHARGISILGLIFNNPVPPENDPDTHRTIPTILQISGLQSFGELPYCAGFPTTWDSHRERLIAACDVGALLERLGLRSVA